MASRKRASGGYMGSQWIKSEGSISHFFERADGWGDDFTQFARLIAEAEANGVWTTQNVTRLAEAMDLTSADVIDIIDRAQRSWDLIKKGI